jgi:hypothetical protein
MNWLRSIFLKGYSLSQFKALGLPGDAILARTFLQSTSNQIDITSQHCILCQEPFLVATWSKDPGVPSAQFLEIRTGKEKTAILGLRLSRIVEIGKTKLYLFEILTVSNNSRSFFLRELLYRKSRSSVPKKIFNIFSALYAHPRQVIIVSFSAADLFNIFPMDFQAHLRDEGRYVLGLRNTNVTLQHVIKHKRLVVADIASVEPTVIYQLGKHHSTRPPSIQSLPFEVIPSKEFNIPVPAFASEYKELEIEAVFPLGGHTLLVGKVVKSVSLSGDTNKFRHIDTIAFLSSSKHYGKYHLPG